MTNNPRGGWTSASNALADSLCPGRHQAQRGLTEEGDDKDRQYGSKIHAALAQGVDSSLSLSLEEKETYDACCAIESKLVSQFFGDLDCKSFREQRYWLTVPQDGATLQHSGQVDVVYRSLGKALILEYKTLFGDVAASPKNMQLRDQVVLVDRQFMFLAEIGVAVIQPWVTHSPEICLYTQQDIAKAREQLHKRVIASNTAGAARIPGEAQCKFCLAAKAGTCVEYQRWAGQIAPPALVHVLDVPMASWTPEQRAIAAGALKPCQDFLEQLKQFLKDGLAKDPDFVPGWVLADGAKRETITDPQKCFERFVAVGGTLEQFMTCLTVKKGELRSAVHQATGATGASLDKAVRTLTDGLVAATATAPSLRKVKP